MTSPPVTKHSPRIAAVLELIVEAVKESGAHGMPGGSLYEVFMWRLYLSHNRRKRYGDVP